MSAPAQPDPCLAEVERPALGGGRRIRVVEVLATGTNGGAQEHLYSLVTRIDATRYDVSVVSLSAGSAVRKLQRAGVPVLVIDDPDASDLSPGVLLVYAYIRHALATGLRRLDFLRGDEPYKYSWGAVDEPIQRILVRRREDVVG